MKIMQKLFKMTRSYNIKLTYIQSQPCINSICTNLVIIRYVGDPQSNLYRMPIPTDQRKKACCHSCQVAWQKTISWEDRVGKEFADEFRQKMSKLSSENNPSTFPGVAKKISNGLKSYLKNNPTVRLGKNNSFYGKHHSAKTKEYLSQSKIGKQSYNKEQLLKQNQNTPKKENHPNWRGGISNGEYGLEFNNKLKTYIKSFYNLTCRLCNATNTPLDVHHIDYNKKNNLFENLVPLCKHCHGKTNYDRDKWIRLFKNMQ